MIAALYRVGATLLLALTLVLIWTPAHAAFPATQSNPSACTVAPCYTYNGYPTPAQAGAAYVGKAFVGGGCANGTEPFSIYYKTYVGYNSGTNKLEFTVWYCNDSAQLSNSFQTPSVVSVAPTAPTYSCPSSSTLSGSTCTCTPPAVENTTYNGCGPSPDDAMCAGAALLDSTAFGNRDIQVSGKVGSGEACMPVAGVSAGNGCKIAFLRDVSYQKDGVWISEGRYSYPGATSSTCAIATSTLPATPDTCKGGQPGQVNGVTVCVPFSKDSPTVTDQKKDGTTTGPAGTETKSETKTTECSNGSCNTTTTTTNSSGTSVTTNVTNQPKGEYCAANPGGKECSDGSAFSGDCTAGFTYDGDAIQGAIAKEVYNQNCIWNKVTPESAKYDTAKVKTGNQTTNLPGNETVAISSASFNTSNALGAGSCISNLTLNVLGSSVTLPLSNICPWLAYFRYILLAVGFFMAYRIVFGK
jgi:hypothetical protein